MVPQGKKQRGSAIIDLNYNSTPTRKGPLLQKKDTTNESLILNKQNFEKGLGDQTKEASGKEKNVKGRSQG